MAYNRLNDRFLLALGLAAGLAVGRTGAVAAALTRLTLFGARGPLRRSPADVGLQAEELSFESSDGIRLKGWLLRRANDDGTPAPVIVFIHGWPWNRLGNESGRTPIPDRSVSFLEPARSLTRAGFHVLLFDLRNHGASAAAPPVTFGLNESRDLAGAVAMLRRRPDVDGHRIGLIGYSMGANAILYGLPSCQPIAAAIAVQPVRVGAFLHNFTRAMMGPVGPSLAALSEPLYRALGGPPLASIDPTEAARLAGATSVLYIQGRDDPWGSLADVQAMAAATPNTLPVVVAPTRDRYAGYSYPTTHIEEMIAFFRERLS